MIRGDFQKNTTRSFTMIRSLEKMANFLLILYCRVINKWYSLKNSCIAYEESEEFHCIASSHQLAIPLESDEITRRIIFKSNANTLSQNHAQIIQALMMKIKSKQHIRKV